MDIHDSPADIISEYMRQREGNSDESILAELTAIPVLPDEDDPAWDSATIWVDQAFPYLALAGLCSDRQLKPAIALLLERACYGDPGEIMRGLRHYLEAIIKPNISEL